MEEIHTSNAPEAIGPYSQAIRSGGLVFTSGQIPLSPTTGELVGDDIVSQAEQVMKNVQAILEAAGSGLERTVKTTCFLADIADFAAFNAVYAQFFTGEVPARSCFAVKSLPMGGLVEIECIAVK